VAEWLGRRALNQRVVIVFDIFGGNLREQAIFTKPTIKLSVNTCNVLIDSAVKGLNQRASGVE
jgi:hypothetical protein